jgi:hypothetical protein
VTRPDDSHDLTSRYSGGVDALTERKAWGLEPLEAELHRDRDIKLWALDNLKLQVVKALDLPHPPSVT